MAKQMTTLSFAESTSTERYWLANTLDQNDLITSRTFGQAKPWDSPSCDIGKLNRLSLEVLHMTLEQCTISTLTALRLTNRRAFELVISLPQWRLLVEHAPAVIRSILCVELGDSITCIDLLDAFCRSKCELCGDFAGYLYLLTCMRVCLICASDRRRCLPMPFGRVSRRYGLREPLLSTLPHMRSLPGRYSPNNKLHDRRQRLVDTQAVWDVALAARKQAGDTSEYCPVCALDKGPDPMYSATVKQCQDYPSHESELCTDARSGEPLRFVGLVKMHAYDRAAASVQRGSWCKGCIDKVEYPKDSRRIFSPATFEEHLRECGPLVEKGPHEWDDKGRPVKRYSHAKQRR